MSHPARPLTSSCLSSTTVQSLSWSTNDRYLLSAGQDWKVVLWDLKDGSRVRTVRFEAAIFIAELHPNNHMLFVAALFEDQPVIVDISGEIPVKHSISSAPRRSQLERENATEKQTAQDAKQTTTMTLFTPSGHFIIAGTNKGWLNIIDTATHQVRYSFRVTNNIIVYIRMTPSGRDVVINSSDRIVRTLHLPDLSDPNFDFDTLQLEVEHKFQDLVQRLSWNHVSFSPTGEYVTASTWMNHHIYVWERAQGSLVKILEGTKEELSVVEWHPFRPFVAAVGVDSGRVWLWSILQPQRWSALAPDFLEVEENVEYIEREDEFDIQPLEELHKRRLNQEDEEVDVLTIEPVKASSAIEFAPTSHDEEAEFRMPVILDIEASDSEDEVVAVGAGQFRRRSPGAGREWMNDDVPLSGDEARRANGTPAANGAKRRRAG
ncbi:similar to retinoblastoma-binding protein 5 [Plenodomus lingam JN3]|uniref:Similar to retinoblastoma-binding protein 5 n=1 Tax=Leptosphaeria maculans (strain JN3 / isolate v23.1.3 / race Av1-4-5-6-7-8) TaxID=985895 RepID=E5A2U7_LEPMJ|nr:similar to retinoblastoma-binding protein 5 [Plenodomus lingam JN3]CBX97893.1 similar to retinoblastoma-binding protein 5 [Plenodomus lingam JN3]